MSEATKHMPGPWEVFAPFPDGERFGVRSVNPGVDDRHRSAARAMGQSDAERAANARLIAAAPDLLAAIEELIEVMPTGLNAGVSETRTQQRRRLTAVAEALIAIKKAKGA